jgi:hypothetical protein
MTCDVSQTKPTHFVSSGPIGTGPAPFVFVRPSQSVFRVAFVKKGTRERHRPLSGPKRQPVYCNRRPQIREQATCLWQPSTQSHPCSMCSAHDVTDRMAGSHPEFERTREWTADGPCGSGVFEGVESEIRIYFKNLKYLDLITYFHFFDQIEYFHYFHHRIFSFVSSNLIFPNFNFSEIRICFNNLKYLDLITYFHFFDQIKYFHLFHPI